MSKIYEFTVKDANQNDYQISDLKGKAFIVVNVASKCGLTSVSYTHLTLPTKRIV